jgi:hypothetical protein
MCVQIGKPHLHNLHVQQPKEAAAEAVSHVVLNPDTHCTPHLTQTAPTLSPCDLPLRF